MSGPLRRALRLRGVRTHNLRGFDVEIPHRRLTVITGPSGSGKSSLAFDTLHAEGSRRFIASLSTYVRQFLEKLDRPPVDGMDGVLPSVALEQRNSMTGARATVGTATEIADHLRLLYAVAGVTWCPKCGVPAERRTAERLLEELAVRVDRFLLVAAVPYSSKDSRAGVAAELLREGYRRVLAGGRVVPLEELPLSKQPAKGAFAVVLGRFAGPLEEDSRGSLREALDSALALGHGEASALSIDAEGRVDPESIRPLRPGDGCPVCGERFRALTAAAFSFGSPLGACPKCQGFGRVTGVDLGKVFPDRGKTLMERPIVPWNTPGYASAYDDLRKIAKVRGLRLDVPFDRLEPWEQALVLEGNEKEGGKWYGVAGFFAWLETKRYKVHVRVLLSRFRDYSPCPDCRGTRLRPESLAVRVGGLDLARLSALTIGELRTFFERLDLPPAIETAAAHLVSELRGRILFLDQVGLDYLSLDRPMRTLSGGEAQRIGLASALGGSLTDTLYVLDEPTIGLHARDTSRLVSVLRSLVRGGNTVVCVEHDPDVIRGADHVIDLGPGAGEGGGRKLFEGTPAELSETRTATGRALAGEWRVASEAERDHVFRVSERGSGLGRMPGFTLDGDREEADPLEVARGPGHRASRGELSRFESRRSNRASGVAKRRTVSPVLRIVGARAHNLRSLTVEIPLGRLVGVAGVSGSGKSSLVEDVLWNGWRRRVRSLPVDVGEHDRIDGVDAFSELVMVDQSPIGRSARSNSATYTKGWDAIRKLLAGTPEARILRLEPGDFSFNRPGGRCEVCEGTGSVAVDMQFLADAVVPCEACSGRRFQQFVLKVRLRGRSVEEILDATVDEALRLFAEDRAVATRLRPLAEVGLGYLRLGQSTATLSGGEAQRLKLASFLAEGAAKEKAGKPILFLFDEPTTGLHLSDIGVLLATFRRLLAAGHSILAIEHSIPFLAECDHLLELGPGAGASGGALVASGSPREIALRDDSPTAPHLAAYYDSRLSRSPIAHL